MRETLIYLESFVVMLLVLTGLAGIAYNLFRDGGWIEKGFGNVWDYTMKYPLIVIFVAAGAFILAKWWRHDHATRGHNRLAPTMVLYAIMAAGAYFVWRFALYGTL